MTALLDLLRDDLRDFAGYASARRAGVTGRVWLNANESPWPNPVDAGQSNHRYPDPQPAALREALASLYGTRAEHLLVGRGSDEAIDLLVRALCRPELDAVLVTSPVFGMYAVSARLQGARLLEVPLQEDDDGFYVGPDTLADAALAGCAKLVFVCSPGNPTGQAMPVAAIERLAQRLQGRALVVVDEAYGEYSDQPSAVSLLASAGNIAVLRTLSKAHALAGARIGCLIAPAPLIAVLRLCQAPYPLPAPCVALALAALSDESRAITRIRVATVLAERQRVEAALRGCAAVRRVYPSQGNYLLVRFVDAEAAFHRLLADGVVVRDMRSSPVLHDALRISIGSESENDALLTALENLA